MSFLRELYPFFIASLDVLDKISISNIQSTYIFKSIASMQLTTTLTYSIIPLSFISYISKTYKSHEFSIGAFIRFYRDIPLLRVCALKDYVITKFNSLHDLPVSLVF